MGCLLAMRPRVDVFLRTNLTAKSAAVLSSAPEYMYDKGPVNQVENILAS